MESLIVFGISFVIIFITYLVIYFVKRTKGNLRKMKEFSLLINKYHLSKNNLDYEKLGLLFALVNSFIIAFTGTVCTIVKFGYIWQIAIGFVMLMALIYIIYGIIGKCLKRKEDRDEHRENRKKVAKKMGRR